MRRVLMSRLAAILAAGLVFMDPASGAAPGDVEWIRQFGSPGDDDALGHGGLSFHGTPQDTMAEAAGQGGAARCARARRGL